MYKFEIQETFPKCNLFFIKYLIYKNYLVKDFSQDHTPLTIIISNQISKRQIKVIKNSLNIFNK